MHYLDFETGYYEDENQSEFIYPVISIRTMLLRGFKQRYPRKGA